MAMPDEEIIKAFEVCYIDRDEDCSECPFCNEDMDCTYIEDNNLLKDVFDLINRKDAEIDILKAEIERYKGVIRLLEKDIAEARTDGVKDFAKFLIDKGTELNTFDLCDYVPEFLERKEGE